MVCAVIFELCATACYVIFILDNSDSTLFDSFITLSLLENRSLRAFPVLSAKALSVQSWAFSKHSGPALYRGSLFTASLFRGFFCAILSAILHAF